MNDFISMMGYREYTIQKIINEAQGCTDEYELRQICSRCGMPWSDLLYDEQQRILESI